MIFESLWPLAFLLAIPVVIILYLLRPRGKDYRVSSNLLWERLFREQQSKTFLEKFFHNILMYLQILILLLLVLALMSPYIRRQGKNSGNMILVLDTSGSMQHDAGDGRTRIEEAVEQAKSLIASSEGTAFSIVTNDCMGTGLLAAGLKDKGSLYAALNQVECCDGPGNLTDAESVVGALRGEKEESEEDASGTEVVVFTDGNGAEDARSFSEYFDAQVMVMGDAVSNVSNNFLAYAESGAKSGAEPGAGTGTGADAASGTEPGAASDTELDVALDTEPGAASGAGTDTATGEDAGADSHTITCAASLTNYSDADASMEVSLYEGDRLLEIKRLTLAAGETTLCYFEEFEWQGEPLRSEVSSVKFAGKDDTDSLAGDNVAYAIREQTGQMDAVLIGEGNIYLEKAYQAAFGKSLTKVKSDSALYDTPKAVRIYDAGAEGSLGEAESDFGEAEGSFDGAESDFGEAEDSFGGAASYMAFQDSSHAAGTVEKVILTVTDCELISGLSSFTVGVNETTVYDVPAWGTGFLWAGGQCAGYYGEHDGIKTVVVGFDIRESDFPLKAEFPVFIANAMQYLGDTSLLANNIYEAGEKVVFHPQADVDVDMLTAETSKAGLYEVAAGNVTEGYVVRFATGSESDGQLVAEGTVSDTSYSSQLVKKRLRNVLLVLILLLMVVEWILYVKQTRYRGRFYLGVRLAGILLLLLALFGVSVYKRDAVNTTVFLVDISGSNEQNLSDMEAWLNQALHEMPRENQYGIIAFGKNALVEQFLTKEDRFSQIMSLPDKTATNFEEAMLRALSMIPAGSAGRVVILTDGKETKGKIVNTASALVSGQVELLAHIYEDIQEPDAYVDKVELPNYLYQGDMYSLTATVASNYETDAQLQIWVGMVQTDAYEVHLNRGANQFRFQQKVTGENVENFEVRVVADGDTCEENNSYHAYSVVDSVPKVLLISGMDEDSSQYENLLRSAGCDFQVVSAANAPDSLEGLLAYKSILLENVYLSDLPEGFLSHIETYVKDYGCGLICIGGDDSFALGGYRKSVLETVLPVDMELRGVNEIPSMAMVMVIDHSGSMSMDAGNGASNLDLAITAAKTAVDEMRSSDYVGVITFDDTFGWVVKPDVAADKEEIKAQIETIAEGGGTTIQPALWAALDGIKECDVSIRHVILLTDGQGESRNYKNIIEAYTDADVTLSTVAVGNDADKRLLKQLGESCGGRYYYSDMSSDIPKIFAQEVFLSGDTYLQNGVFELAVDSGNEIIKGLFEDGWPYIYGYVSATPKRASSVLIASDQDDPVLTVMQYGLGHTVAWNTDVTNKWTAGYAGESDYVQLWKRIVDYSVGNAAIGEDSLDVATEDGYTNIVYNALDYHDQTKVEAVYTDPEGGTQTVKLQATAPGRYEAKLDTEITGLYNLSVRRLEDGNIANVVTTAVAVQYSDEYKFDVDTAAFTGFVERYGAMLDPEESFWQQRKSRLRERYELTEWLLLLLVFWFVMDIAFRRFHFLPQDTKLYQMAVRHRMQQKQKRAERKMERKTERKAGRRTVQNSVSGNVAQNTGSAGIAGNTAYATDSSTAFGNVPVGTADSGGSFGNMPADATKTDGFVDTGASAGKKKRRKVKKTDKKQEPQTLDTAALLKKKDQRKQ